jgi:hypothetical protein
MVLPLQPSDKLTQNPCQILQHMRSTLKFYSWPKVFKSSGKMNKPILQLKNVQTYMNFVDIHPWRVFTSCTIHIFADSLSEGRRGIILP